MKRIKLSPAAIAAIVIVVLGAVVWNSAGIYTDYLWFQQVGYLKVFTTNIFTQVWLFLAAGAFAALVFWLAAWSAFRFRPIYATQIAGETNPVAQLRNQISALKKPILILGPIVFGVFAGMSAAPAYKNVLLFLNSTPSGQKDPQFHLDASFYMFQLPFLGQLDGFLSSIAFLALATVLGIHLIFGSISFANRRLSIARAAGIQIAVAAFFFVLLEAFSLWLSQYQLLDNASGLYTGATYSDVNATIPGIQIMTWIAVLVAVTFVLASFTGRWRLPVLATGLMIVSSMILGGIYPWAVQTFQVVPNERTLESEFINRNIAATRYAYGLDGVETVNYNAKTTATADALKADAQTAAQIRIIDPILVSPSFRQLEQYKQYYNFTSKLDVDRYKVDGKVQDTVIAVRELNQSGLSSAAQSWYNQVLVYTHGYGVVAAYGTKRTSDGQPVFFQSGIPSTGALGAYRPQVYFGENSPAYSIVGGGNGTPIEMDYPGGKGSAQDSYTTFNGNGGPSLGPMVNRVAYAIKFQSEQILLSNGIDSKSQVLYQRNPVTRVKAVAPYLTMDSDPYPAVVNHKLVWILDGYTTSSHFPYSRSENPNSAIADSEQVPGNFSGSVNYIRNSVKATVDAYDGSVHLYAWDAKDPVLRTWEKIYPATIEPISKMSGELISHVRYPSDLFKIQRNMLGTYHVTDAGSFYSQQDAWMVPNDPSNSSFAQPPYYLSMQTPKVQSADFSLYTTFIPKAAGDASRNVLTGYLVADSNAGSATGVKGANYGKLQLLTLPRDTVVPGPGQVQNNFNSDSDVSKLLNLLRQGSTEVLDGNLLTLPVGGGLLYVQPVYVRSTGQTSFPLLQKVLVAFGDKIAFEDTLDAALNDLFAGSSGAVAGDGSGTGTGTGTGAGSGNGGTTPASGNAALNAALQAAKKAMAAKSAALQAGDWTAYGKADKALSAAIDAAIAASGK